MSVTIRLAKIGKKNAPTYKVVVSNTKDKRNGRFLDVLGFFNPSLKKENISINKDKVSDWKSKGAIITSAVEKLLDNNYTYLKYDPKGTKAAKEAAEKAAK